MSGNVSENWKFWIQKFNNYLKATELDKKDEYLQCAQLLQYIGDEGMRVFNTFKFSQSEKDKIDPLICKFKEFFQPKKNLTYERYRFINRKQMDGEKIQQYVTDLKNKARNCELGNLEDSLTCSVLISGLVSVELKQRLLEDDEIDLAKAIRICQSVEESKKQEKEMTEGVEVCSIQSRSSFPNRPGPSGRSQIQQRQFRESPSRQATATNQNFFGRNSYQSVQQFTMSCSRCGYQHVKENQPKSTLGIVPPPTRFKGAALTVDLWLDEKKDTDGAEGYWRVHDGLYDLTDFIKKHPGGEEWILLSKGTDITEAFEVHHLTTVPEETLKKFFVKNAKIKRNAPFTFKENGFYRTLKREIAKVIKDVPKQPSNNSNFFSDSLLFFLFFFSILSVRYWSYGLGIVSGLFLGMLTIASHNYIHRKDNFRMYYFQFSLQQVREFRISHILSHHLHTNTIDDLEMSMLEPVLQYMPVNKSPIRRYGQCVILAPLVWITFFHGSLIKRLIEAYSSKGKNLRITDLSSFILPAAMYILGERSLLESLLMWNFIILVGSLHFGFVGLHAAHHHPDIFHDGDKPRTIEDYDWGTSQLDAVMDRKEICGSHFLVLTNFGDHCLHHLFPTLDHGTLEHLYPTFKDVLNRFDLDLRMVSQWDTISGGFQQLVKVEPNPNPPDLKKYKKN